MRLQAEDGRAVRGVVGAHAFEHAHAVVQGVGQHMGGRFTPRYQFAVIPDHAITIGHRHIASSSRIRLVQPDESVQAQLTPDPHHALALRMELVPAHYARLLLQGLAMGR
ncbi:hypothetical protein D3C81_1836090 [compost metagenome]